MKSGVLLLFSALTLLIACSMRSRKPLITTSPAVVISTLGGSGLFKIASNSAIVGLTDFLVMMLASSS